MYINDDVAKKETFAESNVGEFIFRASLKEEGSSGTYDAIMLYSIAKGLLLLMT